MGRKSVHVAKVGDTFPTDDYVTVLEHAMKVVTDRDVKGRNAKVAFYDRYVHGSQDALFLVSQRVARLLGAEKVGRRDVMEEDALDLVNEAIFLVMVLTREATSGRPQG